MSCFLADEQNKEAGQLRDRHQQLGRRSGSNKKKNTNRSKSSSSQGKATHEYPTEFYCPISRCLMLEPVMDREGNTYERTSIEQWLTNHNTSPLTRNSLNANHLVVNRALVGLMESELKRRGDEPELEKRKALQDQREQILTRDLEASQRALSAAGNRVCPAAGGINKKHVMWFSFLVLFIGILFAWPLTGMFGSGNDQVLVSLSIYIL